MKPSAKNFWNRLLSADDIRWLVGVIGSCVFLAFAWWSYRSIIYPWWYFSGRWYFEQRRAEQLVRENPTKVENWTRLGCARHWREDKSGSLDANHRAWQLDPNNIDLNYAVAFGYRDTGQEKEAERWFSNIVVMCEVRGHLESAQNATNNLWIIHENQKREQNNNQFQRPRTN